MSTIYLSGLPRSGSTVVCNILAQHPELNATASSPLCSIVQNMRRQWSDDPFLLSQLDDNFEDTYDRLRRSTVAFMDEWGKSKKSHTIDKNRGWLFCVETLKNLYPEFKMIVCLRDLREIYASIEKQHRKTMLLDFPDHMEHNLVDARAASLFADTGIIGSPVKAMYNVGDVPEISKHLFYLRFEDLLSDPNATLKSLTQWIGLEDHAFNLKKIKQVTKESDSYYRFKYPHRIKSKFESPNTNLSDFSPRILAQVLNQFNWYYANFYPHLVQTQQVATTEKSIAETLTTEARVQNEIADALKEE